LQDQVSVAYIAVGGGAKENFASISVGWKVSHFSFLSKKWPC